MKKKQRRIQIILLSIGFLLILITYFYYPYIQKTKLKKNLDVEKISPDQSNEDLEALFENVEYKGVYDLDKTFSVNSEKAKIQNEKPDIVHMTNMHVILYLGEGRIVNIRSRKGIYNKMTYDCFFEDNVEAVEGTTKIYSDNLDLLAAENSVKIYNNVIINDPTGLLYADMIDYDFETKYFRVSMFDDKSVKMKVLK